MLYAGQMMSVDEGADGREVTLETGQMLKIALHENASTGFRWIVHVKPEILRETSDQSQATPQAPPGRGGMRILSFEALRPGSGELELEYRRIWEKTAAPARTYKLLVRVGK